MAITKIEIINMLYEHLDIPKKDCFRIVESLFEIIKDELERGTDVMISGFGKWTVKTKNARKGRNPKTGADLTIDARRIVTFRPSKVLRQL